MATLLHDMLRHQAWADAEHWRVLEAHPASLADAVILQRLHHIHLVQRVFAWTLGRRDTPIVLSTPDDFPNPAALKAYARDYYVQAMPALQALDGGRLAERTRIPWFQDPPLEITVEQALAQCAMHSHYHRGQNATRLRQLGAEPPPVDLIVWYWKGQPDPEWS